MSMNYWIIRGPEEINDRLKFLADDLRRRNVWPLRLEVKKHINPRTLDQNSLFWMWCEQLAQYLCSKGRAITKDEVHDLMCHKFLGYDERTIGGEEVITLRGTSKLQKGEFHHFLEQMDAQAVEWGCQLTYPPASEYHEMKRQQDQ
jgi:hypothetical protein